jgi:hypothetical protein
LLKYVSLEEGAYILDEIHEGVCGSHAGGRFLAHKAVRIGYYWPKMYAGSMEVVQKCKQFASVPHTPPEELISISSPWPFAQ